MWKFVLICWSHYLCSMRKNILIGLMGISIFAESVYARACPLVTMDDSYKSDILILTDNSGAVKSFGSVNPDNSEMSGKADEARKFWTERYLSVSLPLKALTVTSSYGYRTDPFTGKKKFHGGLDLHARNEAVLAMMSGIVVKVGQDNASGKYVVLLHGNYLVSYCHLSRILVGKGKQVNPAEPVGITGSTGRSTGEHLHVTCKLNGKSIDPWILFRHIKNIKDECVRALRDL